ncbi:MAG: hypothetical protein V3S20_05150 [Dehalococcoidia bacterium]
MGARRFLILGVAILLLAWAASATGRLRHAPEFLRILVAAIFIFFAVRVGLSVAIIAFDLSPISYLIPISFGIVAWLFRPGRTLRP